MICTWESPLMVMRWSERGFTARQKMWVYCLQGLIEITKEIEQNKLPKTVKIVGISYLVQILFNV